MTSEELANLAYLRRARDLMDREYSRPLDVASLARAAFMSSAHFSRQFRAAYGETPYAYLMTRRIERAKALLRGGDLSVSEVCVAVGCSSLGSFSARFTELVGETPTAYRARGHDGLSSVPGRGDFRWITVGATAQPGVSIVLTNYLNGSPADVDALAGLLAKGALNGVHFHTDDLDATFEKLRASDAEIVQEPTDQPWGTRDCAVRDPSGNMVRIDQPPQA